MSAYEQTSVNRVAGRTAKRGVYDYDTVHSIVNSALLVNVAFVDDEGLPQSIPMNGQVEEDEEGYYCLLHAYEKSRFMKTNSQPNTRLCVTATHVDGRVLGLAAKNHSYNYRSAVLHGYADDVIPKDDLVQKEYLVKKIVEHIIPGRWDEVRPPNETELKDVGFIKMRIDSASAKVRTGGPGDYPQDIQNEALTSKVWAGVIPLAQNQEREPVPEPYCKVDKPKDYWSNA